MSKRIDLTGQRFGKLVALEPIKDAGGKSAWRCRCDCGQETVVRTGNLRSGQTKSCGCTHRGPRESLAGRRFGGKFINLTGQRFGKLVVLGLEGSIKGKTAWRCQCDCGEETVVTSDNLRGGTTRSCGCLRSAKRVELAGQKFGKLTVLDRADNIGRWTAWRCRCDCGREVVVTSRSLIHGGAKSCPECLSENGYSNLNLSQYLTRIEGTCVEQLRSKKLRSDNTSGVTGVYELPKINKWMAWIGFKGGRYCLGYFDHFEDAVAARKKAEEEMHDKFVAEYDAAQAEEKELVGCQNALT